MTDTHTHILPKMDDGAVSAEVSAAMLRAEWEQGVDTVVLTPHYYPEDESVKDFLTRREAAYEALSARIAAFPDADGLPKLVLGAEVAWIPGLADLEGLRKLCFEGSSYLLLELPFLPWGERLFSELDDLIYRTGLTPIIAHIDRYFPISSKKAIRRLCQMGLPVQLSAGFAGTFSARRVGLRLLRSGAAQLLASDCHNMEERRPDLAAAYRIIRKRCGLELCADLESMGDALCSECRER